jgi:hypothetical protein
MLPPLHELLVDDLARIVLARLDVYRLLHDRVRPAPERLARAILHPVSTPGASAAGIPIDAHGPGRGPLRSALSAAAAGSAVFAWVSDWIWALACGCAREGAGGG